MNLHYFINSNRSPGIVFGSILLYFFLHQIINCFAKNLHYVLHELTNYLKNLCFVKEFEVFLMECSFAFKFYPINYLLALLIGRIA